jgi:glycosyltransferase involved in cell wall biosynthesis
MVDKAGAGLFLYSGYALEAFSATQDMSLRKLLFVYHPQGDFVRDILMDDFARHPEAARSHRGHLEEIALNEGARVRQEIQVADAIVCASTFTAASVMHALGGHEKLIRVVPYGCSAELKGAPVDVAACVAVAPQVLFVGQGTQRKGLHHLLKVWARGLFREAELTLVVNNVDPGIAKLIDQLPAKPRLLERLSKQELQAEYERADIFVLPSLVEGFGLVYLEALSAGCHVIGTTNTGLPDLDAPSEAASIVAPGNLDELQEFLERSIQTAANGGFDRGAIRRFAATRTWENFRQGIRDFVSEAEAAAK